MIKLSLKKLLMVYTNKRRDKRMLNKAKKFVIGLLGVTMISGTSNVYAQNFSNFIVPSQQNNLLSPRESLLLAEYTARLVEDSGYVKVAWSFTSPYTLDNVDVTVTFQQKIGSTFYDITSFNNSYSDVYTQNGVDSYLAIRGTTFRAKIVFSAKKGSTRETKTLYTSEKIIV